MRWLLFVPLLAAAGAAVPLLAGAGPMTGPRYLLTDREGFVLGDVELVAAPPVSAAVWSSDGRYVLAARQEEPPAPPSLPLPSGALSLVVWNRGTGRSRVIWQRPAGAQMIGELQWLPRTHAALMMLNWLAPPPAQPEPRKTLFWIDTVSGVVRALGDLQDEQLLVSPAQPRAVLYSQGQHSLRLVAASGSIGPAVSLPKNFNVDRWAPDGSLLYGVVWAGAGTPEQPAHPEWQTLDPRNGASTPLPTPPPAQPEKPAPVRLRSTVAVLKEQNTTERVSPLWLESTVKSEQLRLLVCPDSDRGSLAPDAGAVLYLSQGAAWVAPLTRLPREQMLAQLRAAQRMEALSNARQIGLALSMYAQDYDETYPPADGNATQVLHPYVKNDEVFDTPGTDAPGFVYTYTGGPIKTITNPSTQELGYLPGPGGRAVIFADGHAKWQSDNEGPGEPADGRRQRGYFR